MSVVVDIYYINIREYLKDITQLFNLLSTEEKYRALRYNDPILSHRYIIVHSILRVLLGRYVQIETSQIALRYNLFGKPYIYNPLPHQQIQFNMSYSCELVCYAITHSNAIGIDIEYHNAKLNIQELFNLVCTDEEIEYLKTLNITEQRSYFFDLWSRKEAVVKAIGVGLSYPINKILALENLISDKRIYVPQNTHLFDDKTLQYVPLQLRENYSSYLAIDFGAGEEQEVVINYKVFKF